MKELLLKSSALALYDPNLPIVVSTDASNYGLGAVLAQIHEDKTERIVAFASRTLLNYWMQVFNDWKRSLSMCLGCWKMENLSLGSVFTVHHSYWSSSFNSASFSQRDIDHAEIRIAHWTSRLLCFNYEVVYSSASQNHTAFASFWRGSFWCKTWIRCIFVFWDVGCNSSWVCFCLCIMSRIDFIMCTSWSWMAFFINGCG